MELKKAYHLEQSKTVELVGGVCFTMLIALIGTLLAKVPVFDKLGALASAIFIAIIYRQLIGFPVPFAAGISFSSKTLLRVAIVLYGLKLNIYLIVLNGIDVIIHGGLIIVISIILMVLFSKWLRADMQMAMLLGIGTGVCGAAAIAATAPILQTKDEDTAAGVGMIALVGTIFSVSYTLLYPLLPIDAEQYALWSGISLHELAHVALAAAPAGEDAIAFALLAKLGRVLLLIPVSFFLIYWVQRKTTNKHQKTTVPFPWFLIGFIIMSLLRTFVSEKQLVTTDTLEHISVGATFILTMAMTGLGLNIHLKSLKENALRPLLALIIVSCIISTITYLSVFI